MSLDRRSFIGRAFGAVAAALATKVILEATPAPVDIPQPAPMLPPAPIPATPRLPSSDVDPAIGSQSFSVWRPDERDHWIPTYHNAPKHSDISRLTTLVVYWFIKRSDDRMLTWTLHPYCCRPSEGPLTSRYAVIERISAYHLRDLDIYDYVAKGVAERMLIELDRKAYQHIGVQPIERGDCFVATNRERGVSIRGMKEHSESTDVTSYRFDVVVG